MFFFFFIAIRGSFLVIPILKKQIQGLSLKMRPDRSVHMCAFTDF